MADVFTPGVAPSAGFQYYVKNAELDNALFQDLLQAVNFGEYGQIVTGMVNDEQIAMMGTLPKGIVANNTCGDADPIGSEMAQKVWQPKAHRLDTEQCEATLRQAAMFREFLAAAADRPDLNLTEANVFNNIIINMLQQRMALDVHELAWFSDTTYVGGTDIVAGALKHFNTIDGLWKQIFDEVASPTITGDTLNRVTITENTAANYNAQLPITPAAALGYLQSLYAGRSNRFTQDGADAVFLVTRTIEEAFRTYMDTQGVNDSFARIEQDTGRLFYRGIPVIPMYEWDAVIEQYFVVGDPATVPAQIGPHLAVLTKTDNLVLGLGSDQDLLQVKTYYDANPTVEKWFGMMKGWIDVKLLWNYRMVVAY